MICFPEVDMASSRARYLMEQTGYVPCIPYSTYLDLQTRRYLCSKLSHFAHKSEEAFGTECGGTSSGLRHYYTSFFCEDGLFLAFVPHLAENYWVDEIHNASLNSYGLASRRSGKVHVASRVVRDDAAFIIR
jgi:hypothetical protein